MRQSYRIIPIYTADVSGVCSALYELGGMTVMHDPSGCNSTYNTHDEIRWYDQDSLIYISGLTEIDAIMGNDEKFLDDIKEAARELHPKFIALAGSPIPYMNGTDFPALAQVLEEETGEKIYRGKDRTDSGTYRQSAWCDTTGLWTGISCRGAGREPESLWMEGAVYLGNGR